MEISHLDPASDSQENGEKIREKIPYFSKESSKSNIEIPFFYAGVSRLNYCLTGIAGVKLETRIEC